MSGLPCVPQSRVGSRAGFGLSSLFKQESVSVGPEVIELEGV